jgi:transketolase
MLEINPKSALQWSRFGSRAVFGQAIFSLAETKKNLMVLSADLGKSSGLTRYIKSYPDNYLNVGISEQNMIGIAAGIAREGFVVFATSFAPFLSMRSSEQVRMNMGYMDANVKAVALGSGVAMSFLGNSHYGLEDASIMRSIPNLTVVSPADCSEIVKTVFAAADYEGPMYIRLTGETNNPIVYDQDYNFEIGRAITLCEGSDITIFSNGTMVYYSLEAAKLLKSEGISSKVVNMHTIKPLDTSIINEAVKSSKLIISVEEHSVIGGLGGAIAEYKAEFENAPPQLIIGLPDKFGKVGEHSYLLDKYGLTAKKISDRITKRYRDLS